MIHRDTCYRDNKAGKEEILGFAVLNRVRQVRHHWKATAEFWADKWYDIMF